MFFSIFKYDFLDILENLFFQSGLHLLSRYFPKTGLKILNLNFQKSLPQKALFISQTRIQRCSWVC